MEHSRLDNNHCAGSGEKKKIDFFFWGTFVLTVSLYGIQLFFGQTLQAMATLHSLSQSIYDLINTMWWGIVLGMITIGVLSKVPREFVIFVLGRGGTFGGVVRAALGGVLLDFCSHGILMVGAKLYERGATTGQVMAFLVASPWNSFSFTLILFALIGLPWTLAFIFLSFLVAILTGFIFEKLVGKGTLPSNPNKTDIPEDFKFFAEAKKGLASTQFSPSFFRDIIKQGLIESKMVIRWILFGVLLASLIRTFVSIDLFQAYFGPTLAGLGLTVLAATIIEVCSEGSTPIAADLLTRAHAPGNSFAFLMAGISTDYTEIMVLKDTTRSWKVALFLPLITVPQVLIIAWLIN